jgi:uncharacterized protein YdcH (DUF465 family)
MYENLDIQTPEQRADLMQRMQQFQEHPDWKFICSVLQVNIDLLDRQIIEKVDENRDELSDEDVDQLRDKRMRLKELKQLPQSIVEQMRDPETEANSLDPYYQVGEDSS